MNVPLLEQRLLRQMEWGISQHGVLTYQLVRPIPLTLWKAHKADEIKTDCSGSFTCICYAAGVDDPNENGYNGAGNTASLAAHLPHVAKVSELGIGGAIIFAPQEEAGHVLMVMEPGPDPLCFSFGFEGGPIAIRYSVEVAERKANGNALLPIVYARTLPPHPKKKISLFRDGKKVAEMNHPKIYVRTHRVFSGKWKDIRFHNND